MACFVFLGMASSLIKLMYSSDTLTKREAVILKICPPAIITSAGVIIADYNPPINFHVILLATLRHVA